MSSELVLGGDSAGAGAAVTDTTMGVTIETDCLRSEVTVCDLRSAGWGFVGCEGDSPPPPFQLPGWLASLIPWLTDSASSSQGGLTYERLSSHVPFYNVTCLMR